ncbi:predicted protein [Coccidioides posadasii str. Silveira]|uniref:Predicted protein n=1 Tax=Coccidioides posadasii (strain RMSCC 757 / Silveira) TaxID=443226 RepID=E9CWP2_COCPS|nr:predicted protein [Coccidioides posadasii str. Silveira]
MARRSAPPLIVTAPPSKSGEFRSGKRGIRRDRAEGAAHWQRTFPRRRKGKN